LRALQTIERDGADKLAEAMKGPAQQFKNLSIEVISLKEAIAELALPVVIDLIRELGDRTANVTRFVNDFGDAWKYVNTQIAFVKPGIENLQKFLDRIPTFAVAKSGNQLPGRIAGFVQELARRQRQAEKDAFIGPPAPEFFGPGFGPDKTKPRPTPDKPTDPTKVKEITQFQLQAGKELLAAQRSGNELLIAEARYKAGIAALDQQKLGVRARELREAELANDLLLTQIDYAREVGSAVADSFIKRQQLQENYNRTVEELKLKAGIITGEEAKQLEIKHQVEAILKRLPGLTDEQIAKIKELVAATQEQGKSFKESFQDKIDEYKESLADFGGQAADAVINAFKGMEDALTEFVMTGKMNFRDLANSIIQDITRIAIRQAIIKPLVGALFPDVASANGNVFAQNGIVPFAKGGIVDRPMVFPFAKGGIGLMGEAGPEAIMPLKRGPGGRLGVEASGGGSVKVDSINISVQNTGEQLSAAAQKQIATQVQGIVMSALVNEQRSGGVLR
jgi:lambda family phage tail tape measure protein